MKVTPSRVLGALILGTIGIGCCWFVRGDDYFPDPRTDVFSQAPESRASLTDTALTPAHRTSTETVGEVSLSLSRAAMLIVSCMCLETADVAPGIGISLYTGAAERVALGVTNSDGVWRSEALNPGVHRITLDSGYSRVVELHAGKKALVELWVNRPLRLAGRVVTVTGEGVPNATICTVPQAASSERRILGMSSSDGAFAIEARHNALHIAAEHPTHGRSCAMRVQAVQTGPECGELTLVLLRTANRLNICLKSSDGCELAGRRISCYPMEPLVPSEKGIARLGPVQSEETGHDGRVTVANLPAGEWSLHLEPTSECYHDDMTVDLNNEEKTVVLDLQKTITVHGVTQDEQGNPTPYAHIRIAGAKSVISGSEARSGSDGYYALTGVPLVRGTGTDHATTVGLTASSNRVGMSTAAVQVGPGASVAEWFPRLETRALVAGAVRATSSIASPIRVTYESEGRELDAELEPSGAFSFALSQSETTVRAYVSGVPYAVRSVSNVARGTRDLVIEIDVSNWMAVEGVLVDDKGVPAIGTVGAYSPHLGFSAFCRTGEKGEFRFARLPRTDYRLSFAWMDSTESVWLKTIEARARTMLGRLRLPPREYGLLRVILDCPIGTAGRRLEIRIRQTGEKEERRYVGLTGMAFVVGLRHGAYRVGVRHLVEGSPERFSEVKISPGVTAEIRAL